VVRGTMSGGTRRDLKTPNFDLCRKCEKQIWHPQVGEKKIRIGTPKNCDIVLRLLENFACGAIISLFSPQSTLI
jgi:hypothetical protein